MRLTIRDVRSQDKALKELARLVDKAALDPNIRTTAMVLTADLPARSDRAELDAIFKAVKYGDARVAALKKGVRYVSDPRMADYFTSPSRLLKMCEQGACAEDCDGQTALVAALAASLGFVVGLRAWGYDGEDDFVHVYPVACVPKGDEPKEQLGMDTTVPESELGWEPPGGRAKTAWVY